MARSSDSDDYHRSSRRRRYRSSSSSMASSSSSSSDNSRERRRRRRSRSTSRRRRKSRDRSRERNRRSRSRSRRRSGSRDRRERLNKKDSKHRRTRSRRRRSRSSSDSGDSRKRKREDRREYADTGSRGRSTSKECSRDAFTVELPTSQNEAERLRAIEGINNAKFNQQSFVSKRGQQTAKTDENIGGGGDAHVAAMFGTTSLEEFLAGQAKKPPKLTDYKDTPELLLHENLYDEPERRKEKWRKKLQTERRKRLVAQGVPSIT